MVPVPSAVAKDKRRVSVIGDDHIDKAVIIEVRECHSSTHIRSVESCPADLANFHELAATLVVKQRIELPVVRTRRGLLHFRINVPIGDEDIQQTVVVVVQEPSAKT